MRACEKVEHAELKKNSSAYSAPTSPFSVRAGVISNRPCEHIIVLKNPTQLSFSFYDFSVIYYDFFKTALGGNLIDFEKFRG